MKTFLVLMLMSSVAFGYGNKTPGSQIEMNDRVEGNSYVVEVKNKSTVPVQCYGYVKTYKLDKVQLRKFARRIQAGQNFTKTIKLMNNMEDMDYSVWCE